MHKLQLGSGVHYAPGWINVDVEPQARLDVQASAFHLPFPNSIFDQVYMGHFLEHIPYSSIPQAIGEVLRVSSPNAALAVVGPCLELALLHGGPTEAIRAHDPPSTSPNQHAWTATTALTHAALLLSNLVVQHVLPSDIHPPEWPNPSPAMWQCAFLATLDH